MAHEDIVKAWKDEEYRLSLSDEARTQLPLHPAGMLELTDEALDDLIANGGQPLSCFIASCNTKQSNIVDSII